MAVRKQRIFIGSSTETKELAKKIKAHLESTGSVTAWWDDFFEMGGYVFNDLIRKAIAFDFAILIGGPDDKVIRLSTNDEKLSPRDNVYLEYGMFSGILSPNRILFLMHENCRVASDLAGMTLASYSEDDAAVEACDKWLSKQILGKRSSLFSATDIELLPTVGVAVGYFHNFLNNLWNKGLKAADSFEFNGEVYSISKKQLVISVPDYLVSDISDYTDDLMEGSSLRNATLNGFRIIVDSEALKRGELIIHDIPNTLLAVYKTIDFIFGTTDADTEDSRYAKLRALDNMYDNICRLVEPHARLSRITEIRRFSAPY